MAESISGYASLSDTTLGTLTVRYPGPAYRRLGSSDGTQIQLGDVHGALNWGNTQGIVRTVAGIDPVIQFLLATKLTTTGQIWPLGYS